MVSRWRSIANFLQSQENLSKMAEMDASLTELMVGLGADLAVVTKGKSSEYAFSIFRQLN